MSVVRDNLMSQERYSPYCSACDDMPRTFFNGSQFECPDCKWVSDFDDKFISEFKSKWGGNVVSKRQVTSSKEYIMHHTLKAMFT